MSNTSSFLLNYTDYYDLIYVEKPYELEAQYVIHTLNKHDSSIRTLLELGSGTGNYSKYFCEQGYRVTGLEKSVHMIEKSKEKSILGFTPQLRDITDFNSEEVFDAAVGLFHVMSYLTSTDEILSCLKNVHKSLGKNGIFLFDVWYTPAVYSLKPEIRIKRFEDSLYKIFRIATPVVFSEENCVEVNYEVILRDKLSDQADSFTEKHLMRHFSTPEIKILAGLTGFHFERSEEFVSGRKPDRTTWGVTYVLRKI